MREQRVQNTRVLDVYFFCVLCMLARRACNSPRRRDVREYQFSAFLTLKMPKLILPRALTPSHLVSMAQKQRRVGEAWEWGGGRGGVSTISRGRGQVCIAGGAGERKGLDSRRTQAGTGHVLWGGGRQGARGRGCKVCVQNALQCPFWQGSPCRTFRNVRFQASKPTMFFCVLLPLFVFRVFCVLPARACCNKRIFGTLSEGTTKQRAKGYYLEVHGTY